MFCLFYILSFHYFTSFHFHSHCLSLSHSIPLFFFVLPPFKSFASLSFVIHVNLILLFQMKFCLHNKLTLKLILVQIGQEGVKRSEKMQSRTREGERERAGIGPGQ